MKIAAFSYQAEQHIGVVEEEEIISLTALSPDEFPPCLKTFIKGGCFATESSTADYRR
ncbi:hypothetical protein [Planococcus beigongshangi]|uniref:hypothetical protein n=1 Tax=Planococcus beigongshangi TaxID=2782536 RepID=UPI00193B4B76|nr:hypothetical protein [Planococcus beigongshangi]